jgi:hypothetical protein
MDLWKIGLGGCGLNSTGSGQGPVAGCCECGDEPSGSCAKELVSLLFMIHLLVPLVELIQYNVYMHGVKPSVCRLVSAS